MNRYTIVQISDIQLVPPLPTQGTTAVAALQQVFDDIAATGPQPDLVVISGDLIERGTAADYRWLRGYLAQQGQRLGTVIQVILGDLDTRMAFNQGYLDQGRRPYYAYKQSLKNLDFYFLDSKWESRRSAGWLQREQLDWLNKNLHLAPRRRAFIFLHHPLDAPALRQMRYTLLQNNRELLAILHGHNIGGIFAGHLHFAAHYLVDATLPVSVAGAASTYIDCRDPHQHRVHAAISYNVITIERGIASVITRPIMFDPRVQGIIPVGNTEFTKHRPRRLRHRLGASRLNPSS